MANVTLLGTQTFNTNSGTKTVTATPAVGDLIVIITARTGNTSSTAPTDNQPNQPGYDLINTAVKATSADTMRIWIRRGLIGSATSTVFSHAPGTSTGGGLAVFKVTGMGRVGSNAARQSAVQNNQAAATPAPVFGSAALTGNACIGAVFNATNPATMTPRTSWTERFDVGYATPTTGLETMSRDSGETGTTQTWGSASASAFCSLVLELDTTETDLLTRGDSGSVLETPQKNKSVFIGLATLSAPLTLLLPAPLQSSDVPRSPVYFSVHKKPLVVPFQPPNLLTSTLGPVTEKPFVSQSEEPVPQRRVSLPFGLPRNAVLLAPVAENPFISQSDEPRPEKPPLWAWEPVQNVLFQVTQPEIKASLEPAPARKSLTPDTSTGSNPALFPIEAVNLPFTPVEFSTPLKPKALSGPFFPARAIDPGPPASVPFFSPIFEFAQKRLPSYPDSSFSLLPPEVAPPAETPFAPNPFSSVSRKPASPQDFLLTQFLPARDLAPIAAVQWLDSAPGKLRSYSDTSYPSQNIPAAAPGEPPGIPEHFDRVTRKPDYRDTSASSPRILLDTPVAAPFVPIDFSNLQIKQKVREVSFPNLLHSSLDLPPIASSQSEFPSFNPRKPIYSETSRSTSALLFPEVFKPFSEIVWPNAVRRNPLYNLAFDSFFPPDRIPEPPPPPARVEILGGGPKKKSAKEELREILDAPAQVLVEADPAPDLPPPLKPVAKVILVPEYNPPIAAIPIDLPPEPEPEPPNPDEEAIRLLVALGLL